MNHVTKYTDIKEIFQPIDLKQDAQVAFVHALKIALMAQANLTLFHVSAESDEITGDDFPSPARTLEKWQVDSTETPVSSRVVSSKGADPVDSALFHLEHSPADLLVMATESRQGLSKLLKRAIAKPIASESGSAVLFLPENVTGFVDPQNGNIKLRRILIPISTTPDVNSTLIFVARLLQILGTEAVKITLLHVGVDGSWPALNIPESIADQCVRVTRNGNVVAEIKQLADEDNSNLIVMTTQGEPGLVKMLLGGNIEQILNTAQCAILGVPCEEVSNDNS